MIECPKCGFAAENNHGSDDCIANLKGRETKLESSLSAAQARIKALEDVCRDLLGQFDQAHGFLGIDRSPTAKAAIERATAALTRSKPWEGKGEK